MYVRSGLSLRTIPEDNINMFKDLESGGSNTPGGVGVNSDWNSVWSGLRFGSKNNKSKRKYLKSNKSRSKSKFKGLKSSFSYKNYISKKTKKKLKKIRSKSKSRPRPLV